MLACLGTCIHAMVTYTGIMGELTTVGLAVVGLAAMGLVIELATYVLMTYTAFCRWALPA